MTDFVDELLCEHQEIRRVLNVVESQLDLLHADDDPNWELLLDAMYYLTRYPDLFHHGFEDVVFRQLHRRDAAAREFVQDLGREHGLLHELGMAFLALCEDVDAETMVPKDRLEHAGRCYVTAQQRHMRKEEQTVFPRIRHSLTEQDWLEVQHDLERLAQARAGADTMSDQFKLLHAHLMPETEA
ncbi:hemerythrin-like domain-containing protein [Natronocella acetinitrilica]|uniref:Hemerythrin-like domain-containing protein n=1 Tax=Natronocella acetinitrilica TaxID=414046 RepID=A0AAE3G0M6_9GAMM|nr:hemerythrin domain-containing protein [Natronocella acetinitrilica]MCP1673540.1 hemerythrin-like domain-containing protein [Natronocella acetinitrilica]